MSSSLPRILFLAALVFDASRSDAEVRYLAHGHTDLALDYTAETDTWNFHVGSDTLGVEFAPDEVVLKIKEIAASTVPDSAGFDFLGPAGSQVWILPQEQNEELLYLGYGGDGIPDGVFVGNQVTVRLKSVTGPGDFFSYRVDGLGNPQVLFNSRDGISDADAVTVQSGGDAHLAWAITQPGDYVVVLEASGVLVSGNTTTSSGPITFAFAVGGPKILTSGHTDLAIDYSADADAWDVHVGSDSLEESYDAGDVILQVNGEAMTTVPADAKFDFLGTAGDPVWILPEAQNEELLYLGYGGDGIPEGLFDGDQVRVKLKSVTGPGEFLSYRVDGFGNPQVLFNSRDGVTDADLATVQAGGDAHLNWAFTQPGDYSVVVEASATVAGTTNTLASGPVTYAFSVIRPPTLLTNEHVDLRTLYDPNAATNQLSLAARDEDHGVNYMTNECILVANESAKLTLPGGTPFGNEGDTIYVLPQSQNPDLLYLGISAEGIATGIFDGNLHFRLKSVLGPGAFFVWQAAQFGEFNVKMNTADGIDPADETQPLVGSHEHYNWGFSTTGVYQVTFQVSGRRVGDQNDITSPEATFTFEVLPLPAVAPSLRVLQWTADAGLQIELSGTAGTIYHVQSSTDFATWEPLQEVTVNQSSATFSLPISAPARYVRAVAP